MSSFDANAYLAALERPTFTVPPRHAGGTPHTFTGGFLSIEQWARLQDRVSLLQAGALPLPQLKGLIRDMTDAIFAPPPWWAPWRPCASIEMARLPFNLQLEALRTFTLSQATALGMTPATTEEPPTAPASPGPTSSAASPASTAPTPTTTPPATPPATA